MNSASMSAKGLNGQLDLLQDRIRIGRNGFRAFMAHGLKGDKDISISSVSSIQWKNATWVADGYIQFAFRGGIEAKGGFLQAHSDENSVVFNRKQQAQFQAIRDEVQRRMSATIGGAGASIADEIKKLAGLRDQGILTTDEFEAKKKQLLAV